MTDAPGPRRTPSFRSWLRRQRGRQDPVGALARHAWADPDWPWYSLPLAGYVRYLTRDGRVEAPREVLEGLRRAWSEWDRMAGDRTRDAPR